MARQDERVREQVRRWRDELINLSRLNRLLYFRPTKTSTLEIEAPSPAKILAAFEGPSARGWRFHIPPVVEAGQSAEAPRLQANELLTSKPDEASLMAALRVLERKTAQEFMDKGLWVLYLGVGMLEWVDPQDSEPAQSPIWLVPVSVQRTNPREPFRLTRAEEDALVNPALAMKLSGDFGIEVPPVEDPEDADPEAILARFRELTAGQPKWRVTSRLVLSTFSFHKEVMYRDLLSNEEQVCNHDIVGALALGPGAEAGIDLDFEPVPEETLDQDAPPEEMVSILDADASQRQCIVAARSGHSFVMDGPPGTGKSQTIANIIAELLAHEKTVLFVSEKAAALEVVHSRLAHAGLAEFVLALHSHKATRREVAAELGRALRSHPRPPQDMAEADRQRLIERRKELSAYARGLNEVREPLHRSLHDAIGRVAKLRDLPSPPAASIPFDSLSPQRFAALVDLAAALGRVWGPVERGEDFQWRQLSGSEFSPSREGQIRHLLESALDAVAECERLTEATANELALPWSRSIAHTESLVRVLTLLAERPEVPESWLTVGSLDPMAARISKLKELTADHRTVVGLLLDAVGSTWEGVSFQASAEIERAILVLESLKPPGPVSLDGEAGHLEDLEQFFARSAADMAQIASEATSIARSFGLATRSLTLERARELAELGALAGAPVHPEGPWLSPAAMPAVVNALRVLKVRVEDYRRWQAYLGEIFSDSVLALPDLAKLCVRFERAHKGFTRFKKQARQDRRAVASCARSGKAKRRELARLRDASAWQEAAARLREDERAHGEVLGPHFYRGEATDFESLTAAVGVAQRALTLAGLPLDQAAMQKQLARDGQPDPDLFQRAQGLLARITPWEQAAISVVPDDVERMMSMKLADVSAWSKAAGPSLSTLARVTAELDALFDRHLTLGHARKIAGWKREADLVAESLAQCQEADSSALGPGYAGLETDWDSLDRALAWTVELRDLTEGAVRQRTAERLLRSQIEPDAIAAALATWRKACDEIASLFVEPRSEELAKDLDASFGDGRALLEELSETIADVQEWVAFSANRDRLNQEGLEPVVAFCTDQKVSSPQVAQVVERSLLEGWIDEVLRLRPGFRMTARKDREACVQEFRELDQALVASTVSRVMEACNRGRPQTTVGVAGIIAREAEKKRRHMPIRRLIGESAPVAQALKPCLMMSPLTVSQFLMPDVSFDTVIFDEASQVTPADAINAIYRGRQIIVAGDQKQLPPTSFFEKVALDGDGDEWEEEQFDDFESVLDLCKGSGGLRALPLRWHYRSQHEALITFSNYAFYDGSLVTFPSAIETAPDVGVQLFCVKGVYRRGGPRDNLIEADKVVERVLFHARTHPHLSVGVVAFSESQAAAIEVALERERKRHPDLDSFFADDRLHGLFVKNLENVQGDERDIIIFSVGYGPDEAGKFTLQFGPLNKPGGHRRLNVAITRARRRVEVVSSVTSGDFGGSLNNPGIRHLKRYLDYCERGSPALALDVNEQCRDVESPFEASVAQVIRGLGYDIVPQVGCAGYRIDLAIRHPERPGSYALGIECDGAMYHSSKVARDRDRLRHAVLEGLGWRLYHIWGTAWYRDQEREKTRLEEAIRSAIGNGAPKLLRERVLAPVAVRLEPVDLNDLPSWVRPYELSHPRPPRYPIAIHDPSAFPDLRRMVGEVVSFEAPVHESVVLRRVREAWGVGRSGSRIQDAFSKAIAYLVRDGEVQRDRAGFLWMKGREFAVRTPVDGAPDTQRGAQEVAVEEIQLAMKRLVKDARSVTSDELSSTVSRIFGWNRRGSEIVRVLADALDGLIAEGVLVRDGEHIRYRASP
ncbi:MAG: DUF3320 domain-containing protein [Acidobacteria bacterium]|nr:DUF3320 domain-containing protein [Acidobacteriota bacterium]